MYGFSQIFQDRPEVGQGPIDYFWGVIWITAWIKDFKRILYHCEIGEIRTFWQITSQIPVTLKMLKYKKSQPHEKWVSVK